MKTSSCSVLVVLTAFGLTSCSGSEKDCKPRSAIVCSGGQTLWVDSCGTIGEVKQTCEWGCLTDRSDCAPCPPKDCAALQKECGRWPDGCGGEIECPGCGALMDCVPSTGACRCSYASCGAACCAAGQVCSGDECCTPNCAGRGCGPDGCGGSCGECTGTMICGPNGACVAAGFTGVALTSVRAPDRTSIQATFDKDPGPDQAGLLSIYSVTAPEGDLTLISASYDGPSKTVTLTTDKQKLGVSYHLTIDTGGTLPDLEAVFLSADTARFYAVDFATFEQIQVEAVRAGVGRSCVVYIEQGQSASDIPRTISAFDDQVFPILTQQLAAAPDLDGNDRILILGLNGGDHYGGYFDSTNAYSDAETMAWWGVHSNEMEMVHSNVAIGTLEVESIVTHEYGHLLYHEHHGFTDPYWEYHDEGLAECAVHLVWGSNRYATDYYQWDPDGLIGRGLSLVNWTYALYENYVLAYLFWTYVASRLDGQSSYRSIFDLATGDPDEVDGWLQDALGEGFNKVQHSSLIATWVQAPTGPHGFEGMLSLPAGAAPVVPAGTKSVELKPFAGTFFRLAQSSVDYPGTEGPNIVYAGIDAAGNVDLVAPFEVAGGALLVYNQSLDHSNYPAEHSGPDVTAIQQALRTARSPAAASRAWLDPPPNFRQNKAAALRWRRATEQRLQLMAQPAP